MTATSSDPLLQKPSNARNATSPDADASHHGIKASFVVIIKGLEGILDWSPFILVQSLQGSYSPASALGAGFLAAIFVLFYAFMKHHLVLRNSLYHNHIAKFKPKALDIGQFFLFGFLFLSALLLQSVLKSSGTLLVLWFNPVTTGGMGLIMWLSVVRGRPFVFDYAESAMPPVIWARLSNEKWFRDKLIEASIFWIHIMLAMTAIVTIQPIAVTCFYGGNAKNDSSGRMTVLGNLLAIGQFVILFYGFYENAKASPEAKIKRIRQVKNKGFSKKEQMLYGDAPLDLLIEDKARKTSKSFRIKSLHADKDLDLAAIVLADAFRNDETLHGYIDTQEGTLSYKNSYVKSVACFNQVLACFDEHHYPETKPACVMACIPVMSKSQEEIRVFTSYEAWVENGFSIPGTDETNFPLPSAELVELGEMKERSIHGLTKKPYILIAHFGADPAHMGKGYGKILLNYIIGLSESKKLPLVLEATTKPNRAHYEKYGFKAVDWVAGNPDWVLMIRNVGKSGPGEV
eukprot:CAMPEP_0194443490 /NCGR_PEP_ID=MMETSP0176-20130528/126735_1 /TAXON_ID=216777 /ORGANISM="Proboscia alata, Strain PI-D3" /LENGTH=516 /DNA_ID=CAMNT_0039269749 /DNA_START=14 /DNA_END=1564 /DNA_ORIENTATION=-